MENSNLNFVVERNACCVKSVRGRYTITGLSSGKDSCKEGQLM